MAKPTIINLKGVCLHFVSCLFTFFVYFYRVCLHFVSCACVDGTTWTRPEKPCGGKKNVTECVCQDGEKYSGKEIIKKCIIMKNPIETCNCEDGTTWTPKN